MGGSIWKKVWVTNGPGKSALKPPLAFSAATASFNVRGDRSDPLRHCLLFDLPIPPSLPSHFAHHSGRPPLESLCPIT